MSESTPITEPIQEVKEVPPEPKEFRYEYQPTDEHGNNLGAPQVIIATSPEEALKKMGEQNSQLIRLNRKLNRDVRLGTVFQENIPAEAPRSRSGQYEFKPEPLTAEERLQISQDLVDPEKCEAASARLVRSQIGDPAQLLNSLSRAEQRIAAIDTEKQANAFLRSSPDYYPCQDNSEILINWMLKNELEPIKENFARAFAELGPKGANILTERPAPVVAAPAPEPVAVVAPEVQAPQPAKKPGAFGLTRENTSEQGPAPKPQGYTPAEIEKMSGEEYKRLILIPEWKKQKQGQQAAV
jgi:hypothetical protein